MNTLPSRPLTLTRTLVLSALFLASVSCSLLPGRQKSGIDALSGPDASPADLYVAIAAEYARLGQPEPALKNAEKAIAADPKSFGGYYVRALVCQRIGENRLAEENYKLALQLAPKNSDILDAYGSFACTQRRYDEAQAHYAKAVENPLYRTPWFALTNAGNCAIRAGQAAAAEAFYRRALGANPNYGPALYMLANMEFERGNAQAAKAHLGRYMNDYLGGEFPATAETAQALQLAVRVERKLGNTKTADTYEQVLRSRFTSAGAQPPGPQPSPSR